MENSYSALFCSRKEQTLKRILYNYRKNNVKSKDLEIILEEILTVPSHTVNNERSFYILKKIFND